MSPEQDYRNKIDKYFNQYFDVETEIWSQEGRRIDYVLRCKQSGAIFGVEVKHENHMRGLQLGQYLLQASDYSTMHWKTLFAAHPIKMLVFITPAISNTLKQVVVESRLMLNRKYVDGKQTTAPAEYYQSFHSTYHEHSNVTSFLSAFNIGEIRKIRDRFHFIYNNKNIWISRNTNRLHKVNYNFYTSKLNTQKP